MLPQNDDYTTSNKLLIRENLDGGAGQILCERFWSQSNQRKSRDFPRVRKQMHGSILITVSCLHLIWMFKTHPECPCHARCRCLQAKWGRKGERKKYLEREIGKWPPLQKAMEMNLLSCLLISVIIGDLQTSLCLVPCLRKSICVAEKMICCPSLFSP